MIHEQSMNKIALKDTVVLTTVYPIALQYFIEYLESLLVQSDRYFDIVIVNDGVENLSSILDKYVQLSFVVLNAEETPSLNREKLINYAIKQSYNIAIFADCDDCFSPQRVEITKKLLDQHDIIVNDLTLFNSEYIIQENYFSERFSNYQKITFEDISNKNMFGLSNTAIKLKGLKFFSLDKRLVAIDWYVFSTLLLKGKNAIFTNDIVTDYRQHSNNTIGIGKLDKNLLKKSINIKQLHYTLMGSQSEEYYFLNQQLDSLRKQLNTDEKINQYIDLFNKKNHFPLWWELPLYNEI